MRRTHVKSGAVLLCVLTCSLIAISLAASAVHLALMASRESKLALQQHQTRWLLQAGVQRSLLRIQESNYVGETWELPTTALPQEVAHVVIAVAPASEPLERKQDETAQKPNADSSSPLITISVTAIYGSQQSQLRRTHQFTVPRSPPKNDSPSTSELLQTQEPSL